MKSIVKDITLIICFLLFVSSLLVYDLWGNEYSESFEPAGLEVSAVFLASSIVTFGVWVILSLLLGDDAVNEDDLR